jgi:hypothetical protein
MGKLHHKRLTHTPAKLLLKSFRKIPLLRSIIRFCEKSLFRRKWRKQNAHNSTVAGNIFPIEIVTVGKMSYGMLNVLSHRPSIERLQIGNYVSIAGNVLFILSGNHRTDTITNFPIFSILPPPPHTHLPAPARKLWTWKVKDLLSLTTKYGLEQMQ